MVDEQNQAATKAVLLLLAVTGFAALLIATDPGIGLYSDSTFYVGLARRLLRGQGLTLLNAYGEEDPVPQYPFVYPALLAVTGLFGVDVLVGARWLHAAILAANILLVGTISDKASGRSMGAAILGASFMLASYDTFAYHTIALSDMPFLLFVLLGFRLLGSYLEEPSWSALVGSAAMTGLAFGTRYAGAAFVASGSLTVLLLGKRAIARKVADSLLYGLVSSIPMLLWVLRNLRYGRGASGRALGIHLSVDEAQIKNLMLAFSSWASDGSSSKGDLYLRGPVVMAAVLVLAVLSIRSCFSRRRRNDWCIASVVYIGCYAVVLICTSLFLQADLFLDSLRILIPAHVLVIVLAVAMGSEHYRRLRTKRARHATVVLCVLAAGLHARWTAGFIRDVREDGQGYASSEYTESELVAAVKEMPRESRFFSNLPWVIGLHCDRASSPLPVKIDTSSLRENEKFRAQMSAVARALKEESVFIAYYKQGDRWVEFPRVEEIEAIVPLRVVAETEEGTIYGGAGQ